LPDQQKEELKAYLRHNIYLEVKPIIEYVDQTFGVRYFVSGMTKLLHVEYKKPKLVPSKADPVAQQMWVNAYKKLRKKADKIDVFYFVDGVHPQQHPKAKTIYMIMDNANYCYSHEVETYRQQLGKIKFIFLPPYSPNLHLIKRLWKFFKKNITYNKFRETFTDFKQACQDFFKNIKNYKALLRALLTENFHIPQNN
jgi:transposase